MPPRVVPIGVLHLLREVVMDIAHDALMRRGLLIRQRFTHYHVFLSQVRSDPRAVSGVLQLILCCGIFVEGESVYWTSRVVICYELCRFHKFLGPFLFTNFCNVSPHDSPAVIFLCDVAVLVYTKRK